MPCYAPLLAYQCANGEVVFVERSRHDIFRELSLPCGQCIGCRLERSRQWAMRCMHEASLHESNAFVTLTYANEPIRGQLIYRDFQLFMKRLRKEFGPRRVRFYMCGEYGPYLSRPHFHACLFGIDFEDKVFFKTTVDGQRLYKSEQLARLWGHGFVTTGDVTFQSAAYAARYCVQKVTGHNAKYHYARSDELGDYMLVPEFNKMSLKPGIGDEFLKKWQTDIYPHDYVIVNGQKVRPPKFYDKLFKRDDPEAFEDMQMEREAKGRANYEDNTPQRLHDKEVVKTAQIKSLRRNLDDF